MIVGPTSFEIEMRRNLIINMENKLGLMRKMLTDNNVDEKEFNKCFNNISSIMGDNLFYRVLKSRFKSFNVIFKEEIRFLAYDFRKFLDIDKLSNHCADIHEDSLIKINQKQGLILYEIGELIYDGKLNKASEEFYKFVHDENLTLPPYRYVKSGKPYTIR